MTAEPLMTLGLFTFQLSTAPFEQIGRMTEERWATGERTGAPPTHQHIGPGEDTITITGTLAPPLTGGARNLDKLREMQAEGKAWILVSGTGEVMGRWFIKTVQETRSYLIGPGLAAKIAFTLDLVHYRDRDPSQLGDLSKSLPERRP